MAERLAAVPRLELVLIEALVVGQLQEAAPAWVAAVRADVQNGGVDPCGGVMRPDGPGDAPDAPDVQLACGAAPAKTSAFPVLAAHPSTGDAAHRGSQRRSPADTAVRGDDGADAKGQEVGDQLPFQWDGEGNPPHEQVLPVQEEEKPSTQELPTGPSRPIWAAVRGDAPANTRTQRSNAQGLAASTREELTEAVPGVSATLTEITGDATAADTVELCSPDVQPAEDVGVPTTQDERCGWCGSTSLWAADTGSGCIHCLACHAVYNPSLGRWAAGQQDKRQNPQASMPATAA
jgi:hypothetical protein